MSYDSVNHINWSDDNIYSVEDLAHRNSVYLSGNTLPNLSNVTSTNTSAGYTIGAHSNTAGGVYWGTGTSASNSNWATISTDPNLQGSTLSVKGNADFEGEVTIKGKSLTGMIEKIEERLAILHPNPELEDRWDELKELGKRYKELEAEIIEKEKMWAILKK
jgi:hypothetical protein